MSPRVNPPVSQRWEMADNRLRTVLPPALAGRWWITPIGQLGWISPIEAWEDGRQADVERVITDYVHEGIWALTG